MNTLLYLVNGFPGVEDPIDRRLLFRAESAKMSANAVELVVSEERLATDRIIPGKNYAVELELSRTSSQFYYYGVESFNLTPHEDAGFYTLYLYGKMITTVGV